MKLKPILAAFAVALAALAQPAWASFQFTQNEKGEVTHYNGIELPPIQTVEEARAQAQKEIAAAQKAREAEQAEQPATHHSSPATPPQEVFFTGKPYLEETGQYLFLFRHYDPELARWTTADPSGFPDGANNRIYAPSPLNELDPDGLKKSLGKPSLPTPTDFEYGDYVSVAGNLYLRERARWEYTDWAYIGVEGVGNVGEGVSFGVSATISGSVSLSLSGGVKINFANIGLSFGASGGIGASGALTSSKPATPNVAWEAKGLIGKGRVNVEAAYFEFINGQYHFATGYSDYVHSSYAFSNHFKVGLGIEWFE